jgi:hypothetical protein
VSLFGNWLSRTRELQREAYKRDPVGLRGEDRAEYVRWNTLAAVDELLEALHNLNWKPWANAATAGAWKGSAVHNARYSRDEYVEELVDVLHFVGNLLLVANCNDEELNERYSEKMNKNTQRQREGYKG